MSHKNRNASIAIIISSIIILLGLLATGLAYMWSRGCDAKLINSGYKTTQITSCSE